jgi:hypothetical protein
MLAPLLAPEALVLLLVSGRTKEQILDETDVHKSKCLEIRLHPPP